MKNWKWLLSGILLGLLLSGLFRLLSLPQNEQRFTLVTVTPNLTPEPSPTVSLIQVHVAGEVKQPGLYSLPEGANVQDAIDAAQGPTEIARQDLLNLAAPLTDGQRIYIPSSEEAQSTESGQHSLETTLAGLVNINTANQEELETLPEIGSVRAQAIITYRTQNGYFLTIEELLNVEGIGESTFNELKEFITVSP
ncbi:MAG: helix-hairpin-helix domain-containing protein [Anaerolineaceae bacterium]